MSTVNENKVLSASPNYITLNPVGETIAEKLFEMGIDATELAKRCELPLETIQKILNAEIPLSQDVAQKIEMATWMSASLLMRLDERYFKNLAFHKEHPDYPVMR